MAIQVDLVDADNAHDALGPGGVAVSDRGSEEDVRRRAPLSRRFRVDDFGLCHAANQAVLEAFETGLLTCASLAVVSPWAAEAPTT